MAVRKKSKESRKASGRRRFKASRRGNGAAFSSAREDAALAACG